MDLGDQDMYVFGEGIILPISVLPLAPKDSQPSYMQNTFTSPQHLWKCQLIICLVKQIKVKSHLNLQILSAPKSQILLSKPPKLDMGKKLDMTGKVPNL